MSATSLAYAATVDAAIAALLLYVAWAVGRRATSDEGRGALRAFAIWWAGLAVTVAGNAIKETAAAVGVENDASVVSALNTFQYVYVAALCAAVWGLLYYLVYLYTGNTAWRARLAAFYALYGLVAISTLWRMQPAGVTPGKWFVQWAYARPEAGALLVILSLLLLLPQIIAAAIYLRVARRTDDPLARFRIRLVAWSLMAWLGVSLAAPFLQLGRYEWWQAGGRIVGLIAALLILLAYQPPPALRRRLQEAQA